MSARSTDPQKRDKQIDVIVRFKLTGHEFGAFVKSPTWWVRSAIERFWLEVEEKCQRAVLTHKSGTSRLT